jgi:hypothetical protein
LRIALEIRQAPVSLEEDILNDIPGGLRIIQIAERYFIHELLMPFHQFVERAVITVFRPFQKLRIADNETGLQVFRQFFHSVTDIIGNLINEYHLFIRQTFHAFCYIKKASFFGNKNGHRGVLQANETNDRKEKIMYFWEGLVPIVAIISTFSVIGVLGLMIIIAGMRKRKMEVEAYKAAIEKGLPVPEFKISHKSPLSTLKAALIWIAVGVGFAILMLPEGDTSGLAFSSIPILVGVALIISYVLEKKEREKENESQRA